MISVDGPPEAWAAQVAALLVAHGADEDRVQLFFETVYARAWPTRAMCTAKLRSRSA